MEEKTKKNSSTDSHKHGMTETGEETDEETGDCHKRGMTERGEKTDDCTPWTHHQQQLLGSLYVFEELVAHTPVHVSPLNQPREVRHRHLSIKHTHTQKKMKSMLSCWTRTYKYDRNNT